MIWEEVLTRSTAWITVLAWAVSAVVYFQGRGKRGKDSAARVAATTGCIALLVHVALAFHFTHDWRQDTALRETARQTAEVVGIEWSGGLYINYVFMLAWLMDTAWWWRGLDTYRQRPRGVTIAWHAVLLFMFFNATVVFTGEKFRWAGLLVCSVVALSWWFGSTRK